MTIKTDRRRLLRSTMMSSAILLSLTATPVVLFSAAPAVAQDYTSGVLSGMVKDTAGQPVAGAAVAVTSGQGVTRSATTDANGAFRIPALPVGGYEVRIEQSGFDALAQRASVNAGGAVYEFIMAAAGSVEATDLGDVVVTARRVRDFNATDTGLSIDVQDFADQVPVGRSISSVTLFTPGVSQPDASIAAGSRRNQSLVSVAGTSAAESVYYINGLNVTDQRSFLGFGEVPFEFIQSIDTKTGGYQAEFGRSTGGVVNIVTRSGSNDFTGGFSAFWSPERLRNHAKTGYAASASNNGAGSEIFNQYARSDLSDYTVYAGGPLWRDHLFFFGTYNVRDVDTWGARTRGYSYTGGNVVGGATTSQIREQYDDPRWAVKLDLVINPDHRIEATFLNDKTTTRSETYTYSATTGDQVGNPTAPLYREAGGLTQIYKYTGVFADWFTLSALYGQVEASYLDYGDPVATPTLYDYARPGGAGYIGVGREGGLLNLEGEDNRETYRVDADFYFNAMGEHHLRIGYDQESISSQAVSSFASGFRTRGFGPADCEDAGGAPGQSCVEVITLANQGVYTAEQSALYIQDSWDILPNLSLQLGVRNDIYDYRNVDGTTYLEAKDQWAPRIGFSWDPADNGVSRFYGSLGDYYLPIATNTSIRASSGEVYTDEFFAATRDASGNLVLGSDGRPVRGARFALNYLSPPGAPDPRQVAEADIQPMYEREMVLGYEHKIYEGMFADWSFGVRGVYRNLASAIEDTAIGDAVARYCIRQNLGCTVTDPSDGSVYTPADGGDFGSFFPYVLINPGDEARVFIDLQADPRTLADGSPNPAFNPQYIDLTKEDLALDEVERTYKALEFTFERPFDGQWSLQGSYTLAESKGNYEGAVKSDIGQLDTSLTQDYDHAANQLNAYGYLPNHHRHTLKVFGNYRLFDSLNVGASYTAQSGRRYGCIGRVPTSVDPFSPTGGTPSGWYCPIGVNGQSIPTPRGSQGETPWVHQVDLNLTYDVFQSETRGALQARVDVFNLFDSDEVTRVVEQGIIPTASNNLSLRTPFYGRARSYQSPRSIRFGLSYRF